MPEQSLATGFSVCVLCYGDHAELAKRCLESIAASLEGPVQHVQDLRIGLNQPSSALLAYVESFASEFSGRKGIPVIVYRPDPPESNTYKWPLMRRMFFDSQNPLAELVMWFDDDSYLAAGRDWWQAIYAEAIKYDVVGSFRYKPVAYSRWQYICSRAWANPAMKMPVQFVTGEGRSNIICFPQGAWWTMQSREIQRLGFPFEDLRHNGGDTLLGEVCRHQGLSFGVLVKNESDTPELVNFCGNQGLKLGLVDLGDAVALNADEQGVDDSAERRGFTERPLGFDYEGQEYSLEHQDFQTRVDKYEEGVAKDVRHLGRV